MPRTVDLARLLAALAVVCPAAAQAQNTCDAAHIAERVDASVSNASALEVALLAGADWDGGWRPPNAGTTSVLLPQPQDTDATRQARWVALRTAALERLSHCALAETAAGLPAGYFVTLWRDSEPKLRDLAHAYEEEHGVAIPLLTSAFGTGSALPSPQLVTIGLSQVVAAGQPGMSLSLSVTPTAREHGPSAGAYFLRHFTVAASALVIQPAGTAVGAAPPELATAELDVGFSTRRSVYDWVDEVGADFEAMSVELDASAYAATRLFVSRARAHGDQGTIQDAFTAARALYRDDAGDLKSRRYVAAEMTRDHDSHLDLWIHGRASPIAVVVPEVPDLLSFGAGIGGELRVASGDGLRFALIGAATFAGSAYPRSLSATLDFGQSSHFNFLVDAALGVALVLPTGPVGNTRLSLAGTFRAAPSRTLAAGQDEIGGGVVGSLQVPFGGLFALVAAFSARYDGAQWNTTSSLTLAKAVD